MQVAEDDDDDMRLYSVLVKRVPVRLPARTNDLYVSRSTAYPALLERAQRLLDTG